MGAIESQITSLTIVYSTVYSDANQRKHQSSASLAFVWGIHRGPVNSPHKWPVTRKMFHFDDVIMMVGDIKGFALEKVCVFQVTMFYYSDVIMSAMASQIAGVSIVCSTLCSGADQQKHQSSTSLDFVWGNHRWPVDSPNKGASNAEMVSIWWRHHVPRHLKEMGWRLKYIIYAEN